MLDERATITHIKGESDVAQSDQNFFDVYEVSPDRTTGEKYLISGNKESIALQTSLLLAIRQMVGKSSDFDWEEWRQAFEDGFPLFSGKSKRFQANPYWGKDKKERPKIVELSTTKEEPEYRVVEFFPNRSNLNESYLLSGSYSEIRTRVETLWAILGNLEGLGVFLGYPIAQYQRQEQKSGIELCLMLASTKQPPFVRTRFGANGFEYTIQPRQVTVPYPRRDKLSFTAIKKACGGANGWEWGNWTAHAYISLKASTTNLKGRSPTGSWGTVRRNCTTQFRKIFRAKRRTCRQQVMHRSGSEFSKVERQSAFTLPQALRSISSLVLHSKQRAPNG